MGQQREEQAVRSFALAALLPPPNVERQVNNLQDRLFRELGLASAQALPVFAPLAALRPGFEPRLFEAAVSPLRRGFRIELGEPLTDGRAVLLGLGLAPGGAEQLDRLRSALQAGGGPGEAPVPPLPLGPWLWLAEAPSEAEASAAAALIRSCGPAAVGFGSFEYALLEVEASDDEPWWRDLRWRTYAHVRTWRPRT
jgi:hypothetical protein